MIGSATRLGPETGGSSGYHPDKHQVVWPDDYSRLNWISASVITQKDVPNRSRAGDTGSNPVGLPQNS
jgi:hypothetical protein